MPDAERRETQEKGFLNHTADKEQRPGRSNPAGKMLQPEKRLHEAVCVLLVELCERFTFFGIVCNMILFCTAKLGYCSYQAAMVNMCFVGSSTLSPVLVGWLAEYLVGRIKLVCICMFLHFLGGSHPVVLCWFSHRSTVFESIRAGHLFCPACLLLCTKCVFTFVFWGSDLEEINEHLCVLLWKGSAVGRVGAQLLKLV